MKNVVRWTFWHDEMYPEIEWSINDGEEKEYTDAIVRAIREKEYRITGFAHQGDRFCTPVFDNGKRYAASYRQWGRIMADAQGIEDEYVYAQCAWCAPPEGLNLPKPGDWDESAESLERQNQRWQADREREKQALIKDLETLDRVLGQSPKDQEK